MTERKPLALDIDDILKNNFALADFMLVPELRERLETATVQDLDKLRDYLTDKEKAKKFASVFKSGRYKNYHNAKQSDLTYDMLLNTFKNVSGADTASLLGQAVYKLVRGIEEENEIIDEFIEDVESAYLIASTETLERELTPELVAKQAQIELAAKLLTAGNLTIDAIKKSGVFTEAELKKIQE
ncbi:hypothetical protein ACFW1J_28480 [Priestia aryabhattai]|uniref:hypothetical protein n=1 Tax=Priestia aryabhattai TaxID=412384 RepID=UPI00356343EC